MWPLDVKRMEKIFGSFNHIDGLNPGPDIILSKDIDLELPLKNDKSDAKNENISAKKDVLTLNDVMDRMFGSNNRARPLPEMIKVVRGWLQEKRKFDADEQTSLQNSIDCIQKCIEIDSQPVMVDRLSSIARQLKLKSYFRSGCFVIEAQFFTVDIKLESGSGKPYECTVQHFDSPKTNCPILVEILRKKQFDEFTQHIERITFLYNMGNDKASKLKIFTAFDSLERDILMLESISKASINDCNNLIHISPVGVVEPRQGGSPMKLIYFVRPDELFDRKAKGSLPFTIDTVIKRQLGNHVRVEIEPSETAIKLQTRPLCDLKDKMDAKKFLPEFAFHNSSNSTLLHACFVLKLSKSLVLSQELAQQISSLTNQPLSDDYQDLLQAFVASNTSTTISSTFQSLSNSEKPSTRYYVETKDYLQKYSVNEYCENSLLAIVVHSIRFNHPAQVSKILSLLRQQLLFNAFLESVLKPPTNNGNQTVSSSTAQTTSKMISNECSNKPTKMIEMSFDDLRSIHVKLTHPINSDEITMIIKLNGQWSHSGVRCKLFPESLHEIVPEEKVLKVLQRTSSIPDTVNFIINKIFESERKAKDNNDNSSMTSVKATNTMLMTMLQDTGHAGKKRNLELSSQDNSNSNDSFGKEKKRRRTESCDSKASNSSQELPSSISLLLTTPPNNQNTAGTTSAPTTMPSLSAAISSLSSSHSAALSTTTSGPSAVSLGSLSSNSSGTQDIHSKPAMKAKSISLLQPQDGILKQKIQVSKNAFLKTTSRQNSQEASSPSSTSSGMPENLAEILSRVTGLPNKPGLLGKDIGLNGKKLQDGSQMRRNTLTSSFERVKQQNSGSNSLGNVPNSDKSGDDRNFTIKQSNSSSLKMSFTKNKPMAGSVSASGLGSNNNNSSANLSSNTSSGLLTGSGSTGNGNASSTTSGESGAAAELIAKIQGTSNPLSSLFGNKTGKYTIPKIPKISQQTPPQSGSIANALTDYAEKKPALQFSQRPTLAQTLPRNLSPMRQNSQTSPQIQRSLQTSGQSLFPKQSFTPRFQAAHKQVKLNSIVNALHQRQNSAPLGEETGLFKPLSSQQQNSQSSLIGSLVNSTLSEQSHGKTFAGTQKESDGKPLSTPSSPVESPSTMSLEQSLQNAPVIIPVDAIEPKSDSGIALIGGIDDNGSGVNDKN